MTVGIAQAALNLGTAVALGAVIGFERQWRQRLAGLRTNTLVALGAASIVFFFLAYWIFDRLRDSFAVEV